MRAGDWLVLLLSAALVGALFWMTLHQDSAARVRVFQDGKLLGEYDLGVPRRIEAHGPLGVTLVEIEGGRVRIARDPSPRQYCVKAGWLDAAGQVAICLPNRTSIELVSREKRPYDSIAY
ncbi:hypothetical protein SAMN05660284_01063 [Formivibrio citricus]|uniref:Uncharacterized protein n=2 Tax=Formivibrio citricus TaxID=83765 RepID=A0A1I4XQP3_9NEIS|nr:hypothetical protein SAMN05660284_01063 [Formivibrio citricus]